MIISAHQYVSMDSGCSAGDASEKLHVMAENSCLKSEIQVKLDYLTLYLTIIQTFLIGSFKPETKASTSKIYLAQQIDNCIGIVVSCKKLLLMTGHKTKLFLSILSLILWH